MKDLQPVYGNSFERSLRALRSEEFFYPGTVIFALALCLAMTLWLIFARTSLYALSKEARVESSLASHRVSAPIGALVLSSHLVLGSQVEKGQVLVQLDTREEQQRLESVRRRLEGLLLRIEAARREVHAEKNFLSGDQGSALAEAETADQTFRSAKAKAKQAEKEWRNGERLFSEGLISKQDRDRLETEFRKADHDALAMENAMARGRLQVKARAGTGAAGVAYREQVLADLDGQRNEAMAETQRIGVKIEQLTLRAPVTGVLAQVSEVRTGGYVKEGDILFHIVPKARQQVVALFSPVDAMGKVVAGQRATLRLEGFPWTEWGSLPCRVTRVAAEPQENGLIRVELDIDPTALARTAIPIQHGLRGSAEIEIEKVRPWSLFIRVFTRTGPRA